MTDRKRLIELLFCLKRQIALSAIVLSFGLTLLLMCAETVLAESGPEDAESVSTIRINPLTKKTRKISSGPPALRWKYLYLERPIGDLKLSYELNKERLTSKGEQSEDTVGEWREGFGLSTKGWFYHPGLLSFVLDLDTEWIQTTRNDSDSTSDGRDSGSLNAYRLNMDMLQFKPYSLHLFGTKYQNSFRSTFAQRAVIDTDAYGASLSLKYKILPTTLGYSNTSTDNRGALISSLDQDYYTLNMRHQRADSNTSLSTYFRDSVQTNEGVDTAVQSSRSRLNSTYFIKRDVLKKVESDLTFNWTDTAGEDSVSFTNSDLRWTEQLYWRYRKNLWTDYRLLYQNLQTNGSGISTAAADASLNHLLYENLTTVVAGEVRRNDTGGSIDDIYTGSLDFDYSRRIPWGNINLNTILDGVFTTRDAGGSSAWATNESHRVTSGGVTFLQEENVDTDSIRVTDRSGSIVYIRDQDYTVEVSGSLVRITPTLFGSISDGQVVLVTYRYGNSSGYSDILFGRGAGVSVFLWSAVTLSYDFYSRSQDVISGVTSNTAIDETVHRTQARLQWLWTDTTLSYDVYDTLLASARSTWRLNEQLTFQPVREVMLTFSGYLGNTQFTSTDETEDFYRISTKINWSPFYWLRTGFEAYQYDISGNVQNDSNVGVLGFVDLFYGRWICNLSYRYLDDTYEDRDYQRERQGLMVRLSRTF